MQEYLCLTVIGKVGESESAFKSRLYSFWSHFLRNHPDDYERVYSEATEFESEQGRVTRQYMVEPDGLAALTTQMTAQGLEFLAVDEDDLYSKAEASSSPDWFQIAH